ncbi:MAG: glycine--tRNA ligase subunit beta, partial [Pseudomonadota bacterium]
MARATKSKADSLLIELRTEELPPKSLRRLSEVFAEGVEKALRDAHLLTDGSTTTPFATPRRLAVRVSGVLAQQTDREQNRQGPKEGAPAQAVEGFARGL